MTCTDMYGSYWLVWPILADMAYIILAGIAETGRYGRHWHLWRILAGIAVTGIYGGYWQVWLKRPGMAAIGWCGGNWQV